MFPSQDRENIARIYGVLNESPDNIVVDGEYWSYDDGHAETKTGFFSTDGQYYVYGKDSGLGHGMVFAFIKQKYFKMLKYNFPTKEMLCEIQRSALTQFRIWKNFNVISMWGNFDPLYNGVTFDAIKSVGGNPEKYRYDYEDHSYNAQHDMIYDELIHATASKEKLEAEQQRKIEDARMMGDYMAKNRNPSYGGSLLDASAIYRRTGD